MLCSVPLQFVVSSHLNMYTRTCDAPRGARAHALNSQPSNSLSSRLEFPAGVASCSNYECEISDCLHGRMSCRTAGTPSCWSRCGSVCVGVGTGSSCRLWDNTDTGKTFHLPLLGWANLPILQRNTIEILWKYDIEIIRARCYTRSVRGIMGTQRHMLQITSHTQYIERHINTLYTEPVTWCVTCLSLTLSSSSVD